MGPSRRRAVLPEDGQSGGRIGKLGHLAPRQLDEGRGPWRGAPPLQERQDGHELGLGNGCRIELNPQRYGVPGSGRGQIGRKMQ